MAVEIERKFIVTSEAWRLSVHRSEPMSQLYLSSHEDCSIRVRIADGQASLNVKGRTVGAVRLEYEYAVPIADARSMFAGLGGPRVEKIRHYVEFGGHTWEVDEFSGPNAGLVVAEIELDSEQAGFPRPPWVGREVTGDVRYYNVWLAERPWPEWRDEAG